MHDWNAARTSKSFTVPANRSYAINATNAPGLLRVVDVLDSSSEGVRHKVSNGTIHRIALEEDASATLLYTRDIDGSSASPAPADWPPLMRSAFTAYLARELAIPVSGRREDAQLADALYKERLVDARRADLNEGDPMDDLAREIFASLVDGCHPQGDGLVDSIEACSRRIGVFKTSAMEEIRAAHAWTMNSATSTETIGGVEYAVTTNERAVAWTDKTAQNDTSRTKTVSKPNRLVRAAAVTLAAAKSPPTSDSRRMVSPRCANSTRRSSPAQRPKTSITTSAPTPTRYWRSFSPTSAATRTRSPTPTRRTRSGARPRWPPRRRKSPRRSDSPTPPQSQATSSRTPQPSASPPPTSRTPADWTPTSSSSRCRSTPRRYRNGGKSS